MPNGPAEPLPTFEFGNPEANVVNSRSCAIPAGVSVRPAASTCLHPATAIMHAAMANNADRQILVSWFMRTSAKVLPLSRWFKQHTLEMELGKGTGLHHTFVSMRAGK